MDRREKLTRFGKNARVWIWKPGSPWHKSIGIRYQSVDTGGTVKLSVRVIGGYKVHEGEAVFLTENEFDVMNIMET